MPSDAVKAKATRLREQGRVKFLGPAAAFHVQGETAVIPYVVVIGEGFSSCTCQATGDCSHLVAAAATLIESSG